MIGVVGSLRCCVCVCCEQAEPRPEEVPESVWDPEGPPINIGEQDAKTDGAMDVCAPHDGVTQIDNQETGMPA